MHSFRDTGPFHTAALPSPQSILSSRPAGAGERDPRVCGAGAVLLDVRTQLVALHSGREAVAGLLCALGEKGRGLCHQPRITARGVPLSPAGPARW